MGIQIGSTFCKLMVVIILERTRNWYENQLLDEQQGFRSSRGTIDEIYIVKRIQQISQVTKNQYLHYSLISLLRSIMLGGSGYLDLLNKECQRALEIY